MTLSPLLHVGYIKTGSTLLQKRVFADNTLGFSVPTEGYRSLLAEATIIDDSHIFDGATARTELLGETTPTPESTVSVWSEEVLLGDPVVRRYNGKEIAEKLHAIMPEAKVLIVVREQREIALSMYREHIIQGFFTPFDHFLGTGDEPPGFSPILRPSFLLYSRAIQTYQSLFGANRVLVLPYELLSDGFEQFVHRVQEFAGLSATQNIPPPSKRVNKGLGITSLTLARWLNRLTTTNPLTPQLGWDRRLANHIARICDQLVPSRWDKAMERNLRAKIDARFGAYYEKDNALLSSLMNIDLAELGYRTPTS